MARIIGLREVEAAFQRVADQASVAGRQIVVESAALVEALAKANFEGSHKRGEPHVGGDRPNVVTGTLRRSIRHGSVRKEGLATWSTQVGPSVIYARRVELGYQGSRGYPYFGPAVQDARPKLAAIAAKHWSRAITGH